MRRDLLILTALVMAVLAVYGQTLGHEFVWIDDRAYVTSNLMVMRGLSWDGVIWAFTTIAEVNWHPLTWLSHMLDVTLWGDWAGGHHLTNVILHALNTVLVFVVVRQLSVVGCRLSGVGAGRADCLEPPLTTNNLQPATPVALSPWPAACVAALFAVHPMHVESVAWVAERKDVLCAFFFLLTLGAYARYAGGGIRRFEDSEIRGRSLETSNERPNSRIPESSNARCWYFLTLLCFILALLAKPMAVTLPFVLLLLDWWPLNRFQGSGFRFQGEMGGKRSLLTPDTRHLTPFRLLLEKLPFFVLSLVSCVVTAIAQQSAMTPIAHIGLVHRVANAAVSYAAYIRNLFWPFGLCMEYPYRTHIGYVELGVSVGLLIGITVLAWWVRKRHPYVLVGWFWYLGMLVPVIGLVQVGRAAMADRYAYLPYIGIYLALVCTVGSLLRTVGRRRLAVCAVLATLAAGTVLAYRQAAFWRDTITLYGRTVAITGPSEGALIALAGGLTDEGRLDEAAACLAEAVRIGPSVAETQSYLAMTLAKLRRFEEAVQAAREALEADPDHIPAYGALGEALFALGRTNEAVTIYQEGLRRAPETTFLHYDLGKVAEAAGRYDEAAVCYREALVQAPGNWLQRLVLAEALVKAGRPDEARTELARAVADGPRTDQGRTAIAASYLSLAAALESANRSREAIAMVRTALAIDPGGLATRWELVLLLARKGDPGAASAADALYGELERTDFADLTIANDLAWIRATHPDDSLRNAAQAVGLAEKAAASSGFRDPTVLDTLAAAYAEAQQYQSATNTAVMALRLAEQRGDSAWTSAVRSRLVLYMDKHPFRDVSLTAVPVDMIATPPPGE